MPTIPLLRGFTTRFSQLYPDSGTPPRGGTDAFLSRPDVSVFRSQAILEGGYKLLKPRACFIFSDAISQSTLTVAYVNTSVLHYFHLPYSVIIYIECYSSFYAPSSRR